MNNDKKVMLVTGGSRGIGRATVELAIERGYNLCINYAQSGDAAMALVEQAQSAGLEAIAVQADVADKKQVDALFEEVQRKFNRLDVLVNNAGIVSKASTLEEITEDNLQRILDINVSGLSLIHISEPTRPY